MWDSTKYEIKAIVKRDGSVVGEVPLEFSGKPSFFITTYKAKKAGTYDVLVYAYDPRNGNTGVDRLSFTVK